MKTARLLIIVVGVLLPFLARIPGALIKGKSWFTSYFEGGLTSCAVLGKHPAHHPQL